MYVASSNAEAVANLLVNLSFNCLLVGIEPQVQFAKKIITHLNYTNLFYFRIYLIVKYNRECYW